MVDAGLTAVINNGKNHRKMCIIHFFGKVNISRSNQIQGNHPGTKFRKQFPWEGRAEFFQRFQLQVSVVEIAVIISQIPDTVGSLVFGIKSVGVIVLQCFTLSIHSGLNTHGGPWCFPVIPMPACVSSGQTTF